MADHSTGQLAGKTQASLAACLLLLAIVFYTGSCRSKGEVIANTISFHSKLSEYGLYKTGMADLMPEEGVEIYEIGSALFTDYAEKQRLLKIPYGKSITVNGSGLPVFPDGTILAKTFYYSKPDLGKRQIIETRLLILAQGKWNAATYQWNTAQTNADLLTGGAVVPITFEDHSGVHRKLTYQIPSQKDCSACHRSDDKLIPIGPKAQNLNRTVVAEGKRQNQLDYFMKKGIFKHAATAAIGSLPGYTDSSLVLSKRARAYLDINCAHCHQPTGMASNTSLNLGYSVPFEQTGVYFNKQSIVVRISTMGDYHMPKIGTGVLDDEGVRLVKAYIKALGSRPDGHNGAEVSK